MPASPMNRVIEHLRKSADFGAAARLTDAELLTRFLDCRDLAALEALVRRHAPMVWSVCRRIVPNHHDAEEAFQAVFLVLLRKAAAISPREMLANWLYGVARQTALKANSLLSLRHKRERQVHHMPEPEATPVEPACAFEPFLDEELSRLPDKDRLVIVLCDLEGRSRKEVARQLGLPEGTVASRLARARAKLARRLARHGLLVSGGTLALLLADEAAAKVPAALASSTIQMLAKAAMGGSVPTGIVSLMEGVLKAMLVNKLKKVSAVAELVAIAGVNGLTSWTTAADPPAPSWPGKNSALAGPDNRIDKAAAAGTIQGVWTLVSAEMDGRRLRVEKGAAQLFVTNVCWIWVERDRDRGFAYNLHAQSTPKQVDLAPLFPTGSEEKEVFAIYQLDGDTLMVCEGYKDRPTTFSAAAGSGRALFTYRRAGSSPTATIKPLVGSPVQMAGARTRARNMLRDARGLMNHGKYDEAAALLKQVKEIGDVGWGLFEDTPDKLLADIEKNIRNPNKESAPEYGSNAPNSSQDGWANKLFTETTKDFGNCGAGAILEHRFKIRNVYNVPLEIIQTGASSSGVTLTMARNDLAPKAETYLDVAIDAHRFTGQKTITVHVTFGKEYTSTAILTLKANVVKEPPKAGQGTEEEKPPVASPSAPKSAPSGKPFEYYGKQLLRYERTWNVPQGELLSANGDKDSQPVYEISARELRIPVMVAIDRRGELKALRLYVSEDQGEEWKLSATIAPDQSAFHFVAPRDGEYWLAVQAVSKDGKTEPRNADLRPELKVSVRAGR